MKSTFTNNRIFNLLIFAVILLFTIASTEAATKNWTGATSSEWNIASNWSPSGVPSSGDDVIIPVVANMPIIISGTVTIQKLTISAGATLTQTGGVLTPTDDIAIFGLFIQNAGTFLTTKDITINNGGIVDMSAAFSGHKLKVLAGGTTTSVVRL